MSLIFITTLLLGAFFNCIYRAAYMHIGTLGVFTCYLDFCMSVQEEEGE